MLRKECEGRSNRGRTYGKYVCWIDEICKGGLFEKWKGGGERRRETTKYDDEEVELNVQKVDGRE